MRNFTQVSMDAPNADVINHFPSRIHSVSGPVSTRAYALSSVPRVCPSSRLLSKQLIKEHELMLEFETRRLSELQLAPKQLTQQPLLSFSMEESKVTEACADDNEFNYLLDVSSNGSTSDDKARHTNSSCNDQDSSQGINLPESPFASSAIVNSISTVI